MFFCFNSRMRQLLASLAVVLSINAPLSAAVDAAVAVAAGAPAAGAKAPEFTLTSQEGKPVSLRDYRGKWVVLYFYPKDFTGGCTLEARGFQKNLKKFEAAKAVVLGVSVDSAESHKEFCTKEGLSFKLLSDADAKVSEAYGSLMSGARMSARHTFLISPKGSIAKAWLKVNPEGHPEEVLSALTERQSGKPAK